MKKIALSLAALAMPSAALAHTAVVEHAHPHADAHPYLGIEVFAIAAVVAVVVAGFAYAFRDRLWGEK